MLLKRRSLKPRLILKKLQLMEMPPTTQRCKLMQRLARLKASSKILVRPLRLLSLQK